MEPFADPSALAATLLEASPDGLFLVNERGLIRVANKRSGELVGRTPDEMVGMSIDQLVPEEVRSSHAALRDRYTQHPVRRPMGTALRLFAEHSDGSQFPVEISLSPVTIDGATYTIATMRDVSQRQENIARLALLQDRERIARDIHDMVIQRLFTAGMSLQAVQGLTESAIVRERLDTVTDELDDTIRQLRRAIFELGQDDNDLTLSAHITAVVDERSRHLGFVPKIIITGQIDDLPDFISDQVIATLTEALSNVARHAEAATTSIEIERTDRSVLLIVSDDGIGMGDDREPSGGLANMMWRAAELGGSCSVAPADSRGTVLTWQVPLASASH